jgi:hypothetical protein
MLNDCYFQIKPYSDKLEIIQLANKHMNKNLTYVFYLKYTKEVKIGRDKSCEICLNWDKSYSKVQCSLQWDDFMSMWKIIDGSSKGSSRNGSWIFASRSFEIVDGTIFRVANSKLHISLLNEY